MPFVRITHPSIFIGFAALSAVLALNGCASAGSRPQPHVDTPAAWQSSPTSAPRDQAALNQWWTQLGDPTLDRLIESALADSPDLRTAISRVVSARARYGIDRSALFPSLNGSASASSNRVNNRTTDAVTSSTHAAASLDASWQVDLFGGQRAVSRAAAADLAEAEATRRSAQAALAAEVAADYVTLRSAEGRLSVVQESLELQKTTYQVALWREQSGNASALDTQQSLTALEQARANVPQLEQTIAQLRNGLAALCGQPPGALDAILQGAGSVPRFRDEIAVGIPADTLLQRPDVAAALHRVEAASARLTAQERERLPALTLTGSIGVDALKAGDLFSPDQIVRNVLGGLTAPIFTAGRVTQQIRIENENLQQAVFSYEAAVLNALREVENALVAIQRTAERGEILSRAVTAAGAAASMAEQQFAAGQVDLLAVLQAQRSHVELQQTTISNDAELTAAHIQLYNAVGGGWSL